jgi:hypothetical protein
VVDAASCWLLVLAAVGLTPLLKSTQNIADMAEHIEVVLAKSCGPWLRQWRGRGRGDCDELLLHSGRAES